MKYYIAVLDIGKTNKKILIYDQNLNMVDSVYKSMPAVPYEELEVENVEEIESWFYDKLKTFSSRFDIRTISISTHGTTCVCVNSKGELSVPVVSYTNEVPEDFHEEFYRKVGDADSLQNSTGTAQIKPLINLAKLIYFITKRFPEKFHETENILFYPQYFGFRLTGKIAADYTYTGCHSYLWDFDKWNWSSLTSILDIKSKLPEVLKGPGEILGTISPVIAQKTGLHKDTQVTVGIHDSNSSLIPYLVKGEKDFILDSTGTWCVVMHPTEEYRFTEDEIGKTVFYNISAQQDLAKTAIFMGGLEFESYMKIFMDIHNRNDYPDFDQNLIQGILDKKCDFIIPGIIKGAGQFPDSDPKVYEGNKIYSYQEIQGFNNPGFFDDYEYSYVILNLSLAIQTKVALDRVKAPQGSPIYIEGGFRKNDVYIRLLASMFPGSPIFTTNISEATSLGAAMLSKSAYEKLNLTELKDYVEIDMNKFEPVELNNLDAYIIDFLEKV